MTHIDNSQGMSSEQVKEVFTNLINKSAKKAVSEGSYDRTILAKIQYCSDATLGQYKIQYQNGYYTAYSKDTNKRYSNGASVYVTVPQNDLSNRLFIQDLASNNNNQRTYLTNLEGDQQYATYGQNWIKSGGTSGLDLSSYWDMPKGREVFYYKDGQAGNKLGLITLGDITTNIVGGDGYFRLGAEFKTNLEDDRKLTGNYGLRVVLKFKRENPKTHVTEFYTETYQLDTFSMDGSPFEFNDYSERYQYWEIDKENFVGVESISGFVEGFPQSSITPEPIDIFVRNISLYSGIKLYDAVVDYAFMVNVYAPQGFCFNLPADGEEEVTQLRLEGEFTINGIPVDTTNQQVDFFWAKRNLAIDSIGNPKYLEYFGKGWQCLNTGFATEATDDRIETLQHYTITSDDNSSEYKGVITWNSEKEIILDKTQCKGRETVIKCCVRYENKTYESREYIIYNTTGYYLLLNSSNDTTFYNGNGNTTITAGVFQTKPTQNGYESTPYPNPFQPRSDISFKWSIENNNTIKDIPYKAPSDFLLSQIYWDTETAGLIFSDEPTETDANVDTYLTELANSTGVDKVLLKNCYERYSYYVTQYQVTYADQPESDEYTRAKTRSDAILTDWQAQLDKFYVESYQSIYPNTYVFGPSTVYPKWDIDAEALQNLYDNREDPYKYADIDHIVHNYNAGSSSYSDYQRNTLYKVRAADIVQQMKISVTALLTENGVIYPLETKDIYLNNIEGSGLKYDLQIVNGTQNFIYSAGGKKPQISLKPLAFQLFAQDGSLVFDSRQTENRDAFIEVLKPKWKFYTGNTLLTTQYVGTNDCVPDSDIPNRYIMNKQPLFYYDIVEDYNVNYKERSNIELSITYEGASYTSATNFTYSKQGDLGTNGTNLYLDIQDPKYEQYRTDILSSDMYSIFKIYNGENEAITESYYPNERHLKNTYLYATEIYNSDGEGGWRTQDCFDDGRFCNLRFAQVGTESSTVPDPTNPMHYDLTSGSVTAVLYGYWTENGVTDLVDSNSKWSTSTGEMKDVRDQTKVGRAPVYDRASFTVSPTSGNSTTLTLTPPVGFENQNISFNKPMDITYEADGKSYEWTAYNVVQCAASRQINEQLDLRGKPTVRKNFGYYQIPFFYYAYYEKLNSGSYENKTPQYLDPARHFVIYGGYDEVIYGADGFDPQYNKQTPFTFRLFDETGKDITEEALSDEKTSIIWDCSYGLQSLPEVSTIPAYSSYPADKSLSRKYCTYDGKTYRCVRDHTPNQKVEVKDADGTVIKTFNETGTAPYDFVTPYWEEVSPNVAKNTRTFTPPQSYEACAADTLFSSWVSVKVFYYKENCKYEAAALLPINILQNIYGSDEMNGWDGKKTVVDDGYIISNKIAAGYKDETNAFVGVTLGTKMITNGYESTTSAEDQIECGLFGYGKYTDSNLGVGRVGYGQTLFLDAKTGLAAFGPRGSTQIILNPRIPREGTNDESWSRLAGWYFSNNYLYKPLFADDMYDTSTGSYINTDTNTMVAGGSHKDYYDIKPPDADGAMIPGSVGLYVPSRNTGELTPDTVFMWASSAGMRTTSFNDNGSFDALHSAVRSLVAKFNSNTFPLVYTNTVSGQEDVNYVLSNTYFIDNINELASVYSSDSTLMLYISNYNTALNLVNMAVGQDEPDLGHELAQVRTDIQNIVNGSTFPVVERDGRQVKPDLSTVLTIANIPELEKWYLLSNEPNVASHRTELANLNTKINYYEELRAQLVNNPHGAEDLEYALAGLNDATTVIKDYMNASTFTKRQKTVSNWDTSTAIKAIADADNVTITNLSEVQTAYAYTAYLATQTEQDKVDEVNTIITEAYIPLHSSYETWRSDWDSQGQAISYKDSNTDKKKANFYVTYGGKLHCTQAEVEGKITATSGKIGVGNNSIEICVHKYENNRDRFFLLWNKAFKVAYKDGATSADMDSEVYVDGAIIARSGKIGNTSDSADGSDKHTIFMEYNWYPRRLPDSHVRWGDNPGDVNYRQPVYDQTQGSGDDHKIVKYALWHPYFSIIDDPNGAVNKAFDGQTTDFAYKAGDVVFLGRMYATGGRLGDWVIDEDGCTLRDPYSTLKLKPNVRGQGQEKSGYILSGRTIIYGDGSIDGACQSDNPQTGLPSDPAWYIEADGTAHFNGTSSTYKGSSYTAGTTSVTSSGVSTSGTVSAGTVSGTTGTFSGNVNISGTLSANTYYAGTNIFNSGGISIGNSSITSAAATLGSTTLNGGLNLNGNAIQGASNITASLVITGGSFSTEGTISAGGNITTNGVIACNNLIIGSTAITQYIQNVIDSYLSNKTINIYGVSGSPSSGTSHTHGPGSYVGRFSSQ